MRVNGTRRRGLGLVVLAIKASVSGELLYLAFRLVDFGMVQDHLRRADVAWVAAALVLFTGQIGVAAIRWRYVAVGCEASVPILPLIRFSAVGAFFNQTLPSTFGGDVARVWLLGRNGIAWRTRPIRY